MVFCLMCLNNTKCITMSNCCGKKICYKCFYDSLQVTLNKKKYFAVTRLLNCPTCNSNLITNGFLATKVKTPDTTPKFRIDLNSRKIVKKHSFIKVHGNIKWLYYTYFN